MENFSFWIRCLMELLSTGGKKPPTILGLAFVYLNKAESWGLIYSFGTVIYQLEKNMRVKGMIDQRNFFGQGFVLSKT